MLTPLVQKQIDDRAIAQKITKAESEHNLLAEKQPSLQFALPTQIGEFVLFLCSDAAAQIKGASLSIDGGWTVQ